MDSAAGQAPEMYQCTRRSEVSDQTIEQEIWPLMGYELRSKLSRKPTSDDEYRMQLKDIPLTVIADFVDDNEAVKGMLGSMPK